MINIMIVDDHELVRIGLRHIIDAIPEMTIVAEALTGEQALRKKPGIFPTGDIT